MEAENLKIIKFRKPHRLRGFDYSAAASYFITFNTSDSKKILSEITRSDMFHPPVVCLKPYGAITEKYILQIEKYNPNVILDNYVIMPDHVHLLISVIGDRETVKSKDSTLARIVRTLKTLVTKELGISIWQLDFYDVIAETEEVFRKCDEYIDNNPSVWLDRAGAEPPPPK